MIPIAKPLIDQREIQAVLNIMEEGNLAQGEQVFEFEKQFASHFQYSYAASLCNGTVALHVALKAAGVRSGDVVLTTPFSFIATSNAILYCNAIPSFVDIDEDTFNMSLESLQEAIKKNPNAKYLLLVHLYGQPCQMTDIMHICNEHGITVIEDCAQAHGATYDTKPVGSFGLCGTFSFYPTKNMTTGEGGMITSSNENFIRYCKKLINHGSTTRYVHEITGFNYRLTNIAAVIGLAQLQKIDGMNSLRKKNAHYYLENIHNSAVSLPKVDPRADHVYHQFSLKTKYRDEFVKYLTSKKIGFGIHYPIPIHHQGNIKEYLQSMGIKSQSCPVAEAVSQQVVSIPVHPALSNEDVSYICDTINQFNP
ncbi:DegT/DnrJ/EryC1/StrS family aminotransferase [Paenibacillus ehimensis]|uniref:DegT/DnrJ/EryC1/StrS family aminotransferase n=1 Tax=Paenibacillus ehimensis TaxID=79264 RepID=A0ABT8VCU8_9BACL|nr:DegT/DnrJ/EryC1/StrS family aminotransferase [Paenibacillus ehimensis]MDO3678806.1 DegT/DnrJ/EryC1/StrS family aminotransferase [Paenibacillus ehimensis]